MAAQITWTVLHLDCYPEYEGEQDVVVAVVWKCFGTEDSGGQTYTAEMEKTTLIQLVSGQPFTPYADLTQEQVLGWVWSSGISQQACETYVQQQINNQINPPIIRPPLPWAGA